MKKIALSAGVAALFAVIGGAVQAADQDIVIGASVPTSCSITSGGSDTATIGITSGDVDPTAIVKSYPVICNTAANASLSSLNDGLSGPASAPGFDNFIDYAAETSGFVVIASGATTSLTTAPNTLGTGSTGGASAADVDVTITPQLNGQPLVAGGYSDTLTLSINPI